MKQEAHTDISEWPVVLQGKAFNKLIVPQLVSILHKTDINEFRITLQPRDMLTI